MNQATQDLFRAAIAGDTEGIHCALGHGADIRALDKSNETVLSQPLFLCDGALLEGVVSCLLEHGADADFRGDANCGVLFQATLRMNAKVMEMLLEKGSNPNLMLDGHESLYDWAELTYRYHAYDVRSLAVDEEMWCRMPLESTGEDKQSEEAWLSYLERCAAVSGVMAPDFLRVMRKYGAKTSKGMGATVEF